jgi:hypothetical protein
LRFVLPVVVASVLGACTSLTPVPAIQTAAPTPAPADTTESPADCVEEVSPPGLPDLTDVVRHPERITEFLSSGGDVDRLAGELGSSGLLPTDARAYPSAVKDFDGDGRLDVAIAIQDPAVTSPGPTGSLFLWLCRPVGFELTYRTQPEADHSAPLILAAADLTGDEAAELAFGRPACGAHTCFLAVGVLRWNGEEFVDRWQGTSEDLPTPSVTVTLPEADRPAAITITSGGVQSVGAGPPRSITRRWTWSPVSGAFVPDTDFLAPPVYRIHGVHDADRAFRETHYAQSERLYLEALIDADLLDWEAGPAAPAILDAYIRYRLMLTALAKGEIDRAGTALDTLAESAVGIPEAEPYLEMAQVLLAAYEESLDLASACGQVQQFAETHTAGVLDPLYYGYDNPTYSAEDICPIGEAS